MEPEGIIIGSPTYFAATTAEVERLIDDSIKHYKYLEGKVGAAFVSAGGIGGGDETAILDILRAFLVHGMIVPGFVSGGHYGPLSIDSPDEDRKKVCVEFVSKVADTVKKLSAKLWSKTQRIEGDPYGNSTRKGNIEFDRSMEDAFNGPIPVSGYWQSDVRDRG